MSFKVSITAIGMPFNYGYSISVSARTEREAEGISAMISLAPEMLDQLKQIRIILDTGPGKEGWAKELCREIDRLVLKVEGRIPK